MYNKKILSFLFIISTCSFGVFAADELNLSKFRDLATNIYPGSGSFSSSRPPFCTELMINGMCSATYILNKDENNSCMFSIINSPDSFILSVIQEHQGAMLNKTIRKDALNINTIKPLVDQTMKDCMKKLLKP
jgi:hypothetical protein